MECKNYYAVEGNQVIGSLSDLLPEVIEDIKGHVLKPED
jgi:hypothetical protein